MPRSIADLTWPKTTERLTLRPARADDTAAMFGYRSQPAVAHWLTTFPADREEWEPHFTERMDSQLVVERDGVLIGDLQLDVGDPWSQREVRDQATGTMAEIGYVSRSRPRREGIRHRGGASPAADLPSRTSAYAG